MNPFITHEELFVELESLVTKYKIMTLEVMVEILNVKISGNERACTTKERLQKVFELSTRNRMSFLTDLFTLKSPLLSYRSLDYSADELPNDGSLCLAFQNMPRRPVFGFSKINTM